MRDGFISPGRSARKPGVLVLPGPAGCSVTTTWELQSVPGEARAGATGGAFTDARLHRLLCPSRITQDCCSPSRN